MIFWLVLKLERLVLELYYLEGFWFFSEDFLTITFLHGKKYLSFHNSSFALKYFFFLLSIYYKSQ